MSKFLWIYFVITIPLTLLIVGSWWFLDRRRERQYALEDEDIERGIERLETDILAVMRKKTMSKASTWNSSGQHGFRIGHHHHDGGGGGGGANAAGANADIASGNGHAVVRKEG